MTYYEELGLPAGASRKDLRQAYKHMVRLLHPDQCTDDHTRRLADLQMKRLNGILAILLDPEGRAAYDHSLLAKPARRIDPRLWLRDPRWRRPALAIAIALLVLACCAVFPLPPPPLPPAVQATAPPPATPQPPHPRRGASRGIRRAATAGEASPPEVRSSEPPPVRTELHTAEPALAAPKPSEPAELRTPQSIAGEWLFVASPAIKSSGYPPEYIELRVNDDHGAIRGRYRARYRVADRAISPNVAFQFEGRIPPQGGVLPWRGAGGSQGEIGLRLLDNGDLDVEWAANQMGEEWD